MHCRSVVRDRGFLSRFTPVGAEAGEDLAERLIVCRNPVLADRRTWKREELLSATEKDLEKIVKAVLRAKNPLRGKDKIALRVGKWIDKHHVGKHFELTFKDDRFIWNRNEEKIREEAALDGLYVIRTSLSQEVLGAEKTVGAYKSLSQVERAFRSGKQVDVEIRPIYHRLSDRVKAHVFLCMLAYYVEWQMKQKLAPLLFAEEDREGAAQKRTDIVSPAVSSDATQKKACTHRTSDDLPVQTFGGLLDDLGTLVKNMMQAGKDEGACFTMLTRSTPFQQKELDLHCVALDPLNMETPISREFYRPPTTVPKGLRIPQPLFLLASLISKKSVPRVRDVHYRVIFAIDV